MDIPINAKVSCSDGPCGESTRVLLKPTTEEITDLVVESNESFPETEYMVSINMVIEGTPDQIRLNCSSDELSKMPVFDKVDFVPSLAGYIGSPYMIWPFYAHKAFDITLVKEHIPADELTIQRGARVKATDGYVGRVDEFLIDPGVGCITHLVMREGHLWGQKDVTIPVSQIDHYEDNIVYLNLNKPAIEKLPYIPVRRRGER